MSTDLPLILLHGWGLHGGIWTTLAEGLAPEYRVIQADLPGYVGSPSCQPYTAQGLAVALADCYPEPCILVGWSMGGMVAQAWAAARPEQIRGLVLVGTTPTFVSRPDWPHGLAPEVLSGFAESLARDYRATLARFLALQARGGDEARAVIGRLRETVYARGEPDPRILADGLGLLRGVDLRDAVGGIACPTLLLHGGYDGLCPPAAAEWLAERLAHARLELHPRAAHAPFMSHPVWFLKQLRDFLGEFSA